VAAHQFNAAARAIQSLGQQPNQRFIRGGVHGRRSDFDSQFIAKWFTYFIGGGARLQFYRQQGPVRLGAKEIWSRHVAEWA
jgi:hypothetical protein